MYQQSFIYKFLLTPQFRVWRYASLIVFFTIITLNQAFVGYMEIIPQIGNDIYWIIAVNILVYIVTVLVISKVMSRYLLSGKYMQVVAYIILCATLFLAIPNITYFSYMDNYDLLSESVLIDNLSSFGIYILCVSGVITPIFLKNWLISNQHLIQLKTKQASSHIEQFKEQINPPSFFKVLNRSKDLAKQEPDKASAMLIKLGQLLRYQLYDCNREQVLLTAEISFLRDFLELEKLCSSKFDYSIETEGNMNGIFVSPSVLLPYVQSAINVLDSRNERHIVDIRLSNADSVICITLRILGISNSIGIQKELLKVKERLNALCMDSYTLTVVKDKYGESTEIVLQLDQR